MNIEINKPAIYTQSEKIIKSLYGPDAKFRDGQYEAIEATMTRKRVLVVQRTGWGKSLVYFVCTKLMRQEKRGVTMVVSPLLSLMDNQLDAATRMGLRCDVLNSDVRDRRGEILDMLEKNELDLILITPETLFGDEVKRRLKNIKIGLFVIDEAHCISDWGHDFRLDYSNLRTVISALNPTVQILATTATANKRVVEDLEKQLGGNVFVSRGPLTRESLSIQVLQMPDKITRYAWILENIKKLPGSGIIYCLTQRDCDYLEDFLRKNGIKVAAYHSGRDNELNRETAKKFQNNEIKAMIATIKLGMGYDKGDISFVIHYQMPKNIVSYYQQIGRAGRSIDHAYTFLMFGREDVDILNHFIKNAFPTESESYNVMNYIESNDGVSINQILRAVNIRRERVEKVVNFLQNDGFVRYEKPKYYPTPRLFYYNREHYDAITGIRISETRQMQELATTDMCYSRFVVSCLDDDTARDCGRCANCLGRDILPSLPSDASIHIAEGYVNGLIIEIEPRKKWPSKDYTGRGSIVIPNKPGVCLAKYGDPGYGELVKRGKYGAEGRFCDKLVAKSADVLRPIMKENEIKYLTCVPSLRSNIVLDFSKRLAGALGVTFIELLAKNDTKQQKEMQNSDYQCRNAIGAFRLRDGVRVPKKVLLVDDVVDSRWTLTAAGYYLTEGGCEEVYPFALADSSQGED